MAHSWAAEGEALAAEPPAAQADCQGRPPGPTLELEVEREVAAVNVVVATEVRVVEVPFESDLRIWVRDARGVISDRDPRGE